MRVSAARGRAALRARDAKPRIRTTARDSNAQNIACDAPTLATSAATKIRTALGWTIASFSLRCNVGAFLFLFLFSFQLPSRSPGEVEEVRRRSRPTKKDSVASARRTVFKPSLSRLHHVMPRLAPRSRQRGSQERLSVRRAAAASPRRQPGVRVRGRSAAARRNAIRCAPWCEERNGISIALFCGTKVRQSLPPLRGPRQAGVGSCRAGRAACGRSGAGPRRPRVSQALRGRAASAARLL